ncbi:MAG TPA: ECF-type sigma factor [Planctomycetota bacterium]|jgi:DNA-directed RNA polymerase specialized sigma24 family protein
MDHTELYEVAADVARESWIRVSVHDREDIAQELALFVIRKAGWLTCRKIAYAACRRRACDILRAGSRYRRRREQYGQNVEAPRPPADSLELSDLRQAVARLAPELRATVEAYEAGVSLREQARVLGLDDGVVFRRWQKACEQLRRAIA